MDKDDDSNTNNETNNNVVPIMEESNQTEEERRQIRRQQRELDKDLETNDNQIVVEEFRDRNNEIYKDVRYAREVCIKMILCV